MERQPFWIRARERVWRDTLAFFKGRVVPLILAVLGLVVSYLYGPARWTIDFLYRSVVMVLLSYGVAFVGALVINTVRVPWLLDAESAEQINSLE